MQQSKTLLKEYENLIQNNSCDLSKVTWPHHADGTSEYDDKVMIPEPIPMFGNNERKTESTKKEEITNTQTSDPRTVEVKKNKEMILSEDSVLRFDPDPEGTYMTSVVKGTTVKIKKVGKKQTINGVTSSWVFINFVGDAYNTKGKKIYYKTEGWLFGGCLE